MSTRVRPVVLALPLLLALTACGARQPLPEVPRIATTGNVRTVSRTEFLLQPGDVISLKFYGNKDLDEDVLVRPDGMISVQLLGDVPAAGLTPGDLSSDLNRRYTGELANPRISIIVRTLAGHRVYVGGEVTKQGLVPLNGLVTLTEALQEAGGLLPTAHRKNIILIRQGMDGHPVGHAIDLRPVLDGTHPEQDVLLQNYDIVFVPRSKIANADLFAQQYIRDLLPTIPIPFAVTP